MILDSDELEAGSLDRLSRGRGDLEIGHGVEVASEFDPPVVVGHSPSSL
jgi:hypothetical protein